MKVTNLTSPRTGAKVANQFTIEGDGGEYFQSYDTMIGYISQAPNKIIVTGDYNYSNTTSKYFKQWLTDWGFDDSDVEYIKKMLRKCDYGDFFTHTVGSHSYIIYLTGNLDDAVKYHLGESPLGTSVGMSGK